MIPEEAIQAAAEAIHAEGWTCEAHEPLGLNQCDQCAQSTPRLATKTLEAALPVIEAALRKQIAADIRAQKACSKSSGFNAGCDHAARIAEKGNTK